MISSVCSKLSEIGVNIESMASQSKKEYSYSILDVASDVSEDVINAIKAVDGIVRVRVIK